MNFNFSKQFLLLTFSSFLWTQSNAIEIETRYVRNPEQNFLNKNPLNSDVIRNLGFDGLENAAKNFSLTEKCYPNLGCFKSDGFFDTLKALPLVFSDPETMNVTFILFTEESRKNPQLFNYRPNDSEITDSLFNASRKTKFIVHGYRAGYKEDGWMGKMKDYILNDSEYNVFAVDWSKAASSLNYFQSAADTRIVGAMIAFFIERLVNVTGAHTNEMHCIGHSLGAHTCGFAGQRIQNPKLKQISGFDPAGPAFLLNDTDTRLDPSDAELVLIIHSNAGVFTTEGSIPIELTGILGNPNHLGHFDFWPNGGSSQPGCGIIENLRNISQNPQGVLGAPTCNHGRSHDYPIYSSINECQFIGYECESYSDFQEGKCADCGTDNNKCKPMEFDFKFWDNFDRSQLSSQEFQESKNDLYLKTNGSEPFCLFHYQILVQIANGGKNEYGKLDISLSEDNTITFPEPSTLNIRAPEKFQSGKNYTQLYVNKNELKTTSSIKAKWTSFSKSILKIEKISIRFMSHIDKSIREQKSSDYCLNSDEQLISGKSVTFNKC